MERNSRKEYTGKVVSTKEDKTIKVLITTYRKHPLYGKRVEYSKKFTAHDETNDAKMGDIVTIMETRPLSKTKKFRLVAIVERAVQL
ncbi:MAG: 30S ribosomal protein S17 [Bacilli bacterium]|jgi:small subunit ribosomal protein S17|nr:30S ribosomal protein S17 [Bacilli bacterium]MDD4056359.1 30S ribosomal protein S17 [Bacilli bacterium]MDY0209604.1 30S ribosomal protein S17 [Bacilli bacterium]